MKKMKRCRECQKEISAQAFSCPHCGAPFPAKEKWDGWGFEYKSKSSFYGWPLLHISLKFRPNFMPVPAKGIVAVGQFALGFITVSQFGLGMFCLGQFAIGAYVLAQFAGAYTCIAQIGIYVNTGIGQLVYKLSDLLSSI